MTLKDKFNNLVPIEFGGMQEPLLSDCEKIADDYAIGFAFWLLTEKDETKTLRELLEIFKKEKGYE
jgi:hypothetical protein